MIFSPTLQICCVKPQSLQCAKKKKVLLTTNDRVQLCGLKVDTRDFMGWCTEQDAMNVSQPPAVSLHQTCMSFLLSPLTSTQLDWQVSSHSCGFCLLFSFAFSSAKGGRAVPKQVEPARIGGIAWRGTPFYQREPQPPIFQCPPISVFCGFALQWPLGKSSSTTHSVLAFPSSSNSLLFVTSASRDHLSSKFPRQIFASEKLKLK